MRFLLPLVFMTMFSYALEPALDLVNLDPVIPAKHAGEGVCENGRLIVTILNLQDHKDAFSLFDSLTFELYDSKGNAVLGIPQRATSYARREDFPVIPARASHSRCYYFVKDEIGGETYIRLFDRAGLMWTFGPTKESSFSIRVRYSASPSEAEAAVKDGYVSTVDEFYQKDMESNRVSITIKN